MVAPGAAHAVDGTWTGPGSEWTVGTNWSSTPTVPDNTATFTNNIGAPTSVTISSNAAINTIEFDAAAPAYSFTVQNGATFTINSGTINNSSFAPAFTVNAGAALTVGNSAFAEIGSLAGGGGGDNRSFRSLRPPEHRRAPAAPRSPAPSRARARSSSTTAR